MYRLMTGSRNINKNEGDCEKWVYPTPNEETEESRNECPVKESIKGLK